MANYFEMSRKELAAEKAKLEESYKKFQDRHVCTKCRSQRY